VELVQGASSLGISQAKKAILTTDVFAKEITVKFNLGKSVITICGVAKGAGMIAPNMATLLCFIFTDANIKQSALDKALTKAIDSSFNCITVDGCMSTNDSLMLLANGLAANPKITKGEGFITFKKALEVVCLELAKMIIKDAEGASKFIKINIKGARNFTEARTAGLAVANSNLFKTAIYGENPNFGRISAAVGASGIEIKEKDLKIKVSSLKKKNVEVNLSLGQGKASATIYTSDLTPEYIKINAAYN
jgi:glutamate N-acetyltransferase/amino-acid N-acetyltransferase